MIILSEVKKAFDKIQQPLEFWERFQYVATLF